ncbi:hypothetical protein NVP1251O_85 [Vibrio phage 1.251.O._10N.261.55.E5]|nr:hypothetical protein NVP1251O_85 [Vibrio phage 1.251.O._10N.261.55.E5]
MKAKTIQQDIESKINDWALSIEDEQLSKEAVKNAVVTGRSFKSVYPQLVSFYEMAMVEEEAETLVVA